MCEALVMKGVLSGLAIVEGAPHICDLSSNPESEGWKAVLEGHGFLSAAIDHASSAAAECSI